MKQFIKLAALIVAIGIASPSFAGDGKKGGGKAMGFVGKVTEVSAESVTVNNKKKEATETFAITAETKVVKLDGTAGAASDLKAGAMVKVTPGATKGQAAEITFVEPKKKGDGAGKGAAPGATPESAAPTTPDEQ